PRHPGRYPARSAEKPRRRPESFEKGRPRHAGRLGPGPAKPAQPRRGRAPLIAWRAPRPAQRAAAVWKTRSISRLNAGMSSGLRLLTSLPSTTTSWSTQWAPALRRSSCSDGQLVNVRPRTRSADTSSHGPWQITALGLPCSCIARTNSRASGCMRISWALTTPPGNSTASHHAGGASATLRSTSNRSALRSWCMPCTGSRRAEISAVRAPSRCSASRGPVSSTCSKPSTARIATVISFREPSIKTSVSTASQQPDAQQPPYPAPSDAGLVYVDDRRPGYSRRRGRTGKFHYFDTRGRRIVDRDVIRRIDALAIPPAYTDVWICPRANGHLQATGRDARGRKQYRYHPDWTALRDAGKYDQLAEFAAC